MIAETKDCKVFLAKFVEDNPSIVISIYGKEIDDLIRNATNPNKWKRSYKCKPGAGLHEFEEYSIFDRKTPVRRMGYDRLATVPAKQLCLGARISTRSQHLRHWCCIFCIRR